MHTEPTALDTPPMIEIPEGGGTGLRLARAIAPVLAVIVIAVAIHLSLGGVLNQYYTTILIGIAINVLLAVSLNLVNGFTGQFSIGHAGFMALGAYTAGAIMYYGTTRLYGDVGFHGGLFSFTVGRLDHTGSVISSGDFLFVFACLAGGIVAAIAGYIVGLPSLRLRGDYLAIVTLGFGEIVRVILQGTQPQTTGAAAIKAAPFFSLFNDLGGALGLSGLPRYTTLFWAFFWMMIAVLVAVRIKRSSYGRALLSIREDEIAALAVGVNITAFKVRAFVISAFLTGIGGALLAMQVRTANAQAFDFQRSFEILIMVVLGGLGSISGVALAAILLTFLPELLRDPKTLSLWWLIVVALMLIVSLVPARVLTGKIVRIVSLGLIAGVLIWHLVVWLTQWRQISLAWMIAVVILLAAPLVPLDMLKRPGVRAVLLTLVSILTVWHVIVWLAQWLGVDLADYRMIIYSLMLIAVMLLRPQGLLGLNEAWDVVRYFRKKPVTRERGFPV